MGVPGIAVQRVDEGNSESAFRFLVEWVSDGEAEARTRARCACFGASSDRPLGAVHLIRNLFLLVALTAGLAAALLDRGNGAPAGAVIAAAVGAVMAVPLIRWEDLAELFLPIPTAGSADSVGRHTGGYH